jgi:superfamily I DNA and/or RNA helicase
MPELKCLSIVRNIYLINLFIFYLFVEIGVITPYNYQVKLIEQKLQQHNLHQHKIEIGTGLFIKEKHILII